jgi:CheY-like chemotaxis protein
MTVSPKRPYTVLLVDDDPDLLPIIAEMLQTLGSFNVAKASNGVEALQVIGNVQPDCIVVDLMMPELDGFQFIRALRGDPETAETPLIILSALSRSTDQYKGLASGADFFLVKPVKPLDLLEKIALAISRNPLDRAKQWQRLANNDMWWKEE